MQGNFAEIAQENEKLKAQLANNEAWEKFAEQYEQREVYTSSFVFAPRDEAAKLHWLCSHCFENRLKSVLQHSHQKGIMHDFVCHRCKSKVSVIGFIVSV